MDEYINREALIRELIGKGFYPAIVKRAIAEAPAADVAPVVHGEWELFLCDEDAYEHHRCSVCKNLAWFEYENETMWDENIDGEMVECGDATCGITEHLTLFCPYCGAKMDGGDK